MRPKSESIAQRRLRNDSGEIMRRVEVGESFVVTRDGHPVVDLTPHVATEKRRLTAGELQERMRRLPKNDVEQWYADRAADDLTFGDDRQVSSAHLQSQGLRGRAWSTWWP